MTPPFVTTRRVEFRDTDAAGIMHFSVYFNYMEEAEHELLRHLGLSVMLPDERGTLGWPRVAAQCDFHDAVRFEDLLRIEVWIDRLGKKSVTYAFRFTEGDRKVASGTMTAVCCRVEAGAAPRSVAIPEWFSDKLAALVTEQPH